MPRAPQPPTIALPSESLLGQPQPTSAAPTAICEDKGLTAAQLHFAETVERFSHADWHRAQQDEPAIDAAIAYIRLGQPSTLPCGATGLLSERSESSRIIGAFSEMKKASPFQFVGVPNRQAALPPALVAGPLARLTMRPSAFTSRC